MIRQVNSHRSITSCKLVTKVNHSRDIFSFFLLHHFCFLNLHAVSLAGQNDIRERIPCRIKRNYHIITFSYNYLVKLDTTCSNIHSRSFFFLMFCWCREQAFAKKVSSSVVKNSVNRTDYISLTQKKKCFWWKSFFSLRTSLSPFLVKINVKFPNSMKIRKLIEILLK